jgi:hypothetical protein
MTDQDRSRACEDCSADAQILADLRTLPTTDLGKLAQPLVEAVLAGDAGAHTLHALEVIGTVMSERKAAA